MSRGSTLSRMVCRARDLNPAGPKTRARIKKKMPIIIENLKSQGLIKKRSRVKDTISKFNPFNRMGG